MKNSISTALRKLRRKSIEFSSRTKKRRKISNTASDEYSKRSEKNFAFSKKRLAIVVAVAIVVVAVPVIFATAANSNAVAKITEINLEATASASPVQDDTSGLFEGVKNSEAAVTDGELTSDLTESLAQSAAPDASAAAAPAATDAAAAQPTDAAAAAATASQPAGTLSTESIYTTFSQGMDDPFIAMLQGRLMDLDYMERDEPTTLFGPITSEAIGYFQRKNNLPVDGIAGPATQELLFSDAALYYTVSEGADGLDVQSIQERLDELGYDVGTTGHFGTDTAKAVALFQRMNDLNDDGNVGSETREMLYSSDAEPAPEGKKSSAGSSKSSNSGSDSDGAPAADPGSVEAFISAALAQLGDPYVRGGKGPDSFDCSGLVYYALNASGNSIGYMTSGGWASSGYTRIDNMGDLQRGDVICVSGHVAIYLGGGDVVHASSSNGAVVYGNINSNYWSSNWICGRRPL